MQYCTFEDPPAARWLFGNTALAIVWLAARLYIGFDFLQAGWHKFSNPAWMDTGLALKGSWAKAVLVPDGGTSAITFDWYREAINMLLVGGHFTWFAKLVVFGEMAIGIGLILGCFTGIAAFFAAFMNWNFLMLGIVSVNPVFLPIGIVLMMAWKTAGFYGLDRWLLPALGTPWQPGVVFAPAHPTVEGQPTLPAPRS
ncbi:MAG: DoxX family membrane protein [Chloroflexi bacterium]|nr:DoxX family membrane protein [Chloroflexota bacterium]